MSVKIIKMPEVEPLELVLDSFPIKNYIEFNSCSPIQNVEIIKYYDSDGEEHIFDESNYIVDTDSFINRIVIRNYKQWPNSSLQTVNGVRIRFVAGFGDSPEDVPETVKWAMILNMRLLYDDYKPDERAKLEDKKNTLDKAGNLVKRSMEIKEIIQSSFILSLVNGVQASNQLSIGQKIERAISAKLKGQFFSRDFDGNYRFIADEDEKEIDATIIKAWFTEVPKEPLIVINKEERLNNKGIICLNNLINKL